MNVIEVVGLTKTYKHAIKQPGIIGSLKHLVNQKYVEKTAVDHIDMFINSGESVAYVGPNGAGKSTTIKMLTGILVPTSGSVRVNGMIPYENRIQNAKDIGVVFGQRTQLWWDLPISESFSLLKDIYEIPDYIYKENLDTFTSLLNLNDFVNLPARKVSLGQRMRADLAAALLHNPKILFLDEPTIGLDISVKKRIREFIKKINVERKTTILLTTHDLEDIKEICQRLIIIDDGKVIYDGNLDAIKNAFSREVIIHFQLREPSTNIKSKLRLPKVYIESKTDINFCIRFNRLEYSTAEIVSLVMNAFDVVDFKIDEPSVDTIIRKVYDGQIELSI
ncbi:ATP-binding cassette domain-containing protein [Paenibacillus sp. 32O-W]|uniref:ABC transporter ATP-binding protein n=1 Tax=Paenibacillus sp. 32O-W TaxID=1695218 RepID=UPI0011A675C6|nr:ATP-binding cassette domain-containing protein [Paenibacillus sp. 32O-W]